MAEQIVHDAVALAARITAVNAEIELETAARDKAAANVLRLRIEREGLSKLYETASVSQRIATHEQVAAKAAADIEASKAEHASLLESLKQQTAALAAKHKEADELIAKAKAVQPVK